MNDFVQMAEDIIQKAYEMQSYSIVTRKLIELEELFEKYKNVTGSASEVVEISLECFKYLIDLSKQRDIETGAHLNEE